MMKIIGGKWGGRTLNAPKGTQTRPTLAITRKAVFDICQFEVANAEVLDLFAGSGAMGIEALSRGASHATFVDKSNEAIRCIRENLQALNAIDSATIIQAEAMSALKKLADRKKTFSLIYIDPPYEELPKSSSRAAIITFLDNSSLISTGGLVFIEESAPELLPSQLPPLQSLAHVNSRSFSKSVLHQYRKKN